MLDQSHNELLWFEEEKYDENIITKPNFTKNLCSMSYDCRDYKNLKSEFEGDGTNHSTGNHFTSEGVL